MPFKGNEQVHSWVSNQHFVLQKYEEKLTRFITSSSLSEPDQEKNGEVLDQDECSRRACASRLQVYGKRETVHLWECHGISTPHKQTVEQRATKLVQKRHLPSFRGTAKPVKTRHLCEESQFNMTVLVYGACMRVIHRFYE